ncbi:glycoside hydrolase family 16 protein [Kriegella aquimaris]|nr:glycoside hydrolase family 16 protein [Kriegella aquimaris]
MELYAILLYLCLFISCKSENDSEQKESIDEYELVWEDEFEYSGKLDTTKWGHEYGFQRNKELQFYTDNIKNVRVENGFLILEAHKEKIKNPLFKNVESEKWQENQEFANYSSASITTENLANWTYGKIEVKAKLPKGVGVWPAIWMLGKNCKDIGWPECGEIDIMEHVGFNKDSIFGTVHTKAFNHTIGTEVGKPVFIANPYVDFHTYAIEWTSENIDFIVDGKVYHNFQNTNKTTDEWPFDQPFHLKLNIAIGGSWGGQQGIDDYIFPQQMVVDYVRVYQKK